jgi:hypothetical protein
MDSITIILTAMALGLFLGNFLLTQIEPKRIRAVRKKNNTEQTCPFQQKESPAHQIKNETEPHNETILLKKKLNELDNFKANTNVELQGIKEILFELQQNGLTTKARVHKKKEPKITEKEMHKIIYRSAH